MKKQRILYIEDKDSSRVLVDRVLTHAGYEVFLAEDGLQGLKVAAEKHPDLILVDINLPSMDGREITTRLRSLPNFSDIPIVALTANNSPNNRELSLAAGCTGFLCKPIDVAKFPQQILDFLQGRIDPLSEEIRQASLERHAQNIVTRLEEKIRELQLANERLRRLDQMKNDFIALVSHELRTPLTLVEGYTYLLKQSLQYEEGALRPLVEGMYKGVDRLRDVIMEIIIVSRITAGVLELVPTTVTFQTLFSNIQKTFSSACDKRQIKLNLHISNLPPVEADAEQLEIALSNIIGNAIKFTPDGGKVDVFGKKRDSEVELIIRDTGIGIPPEEQERIFSQFFVLESIEHHSSSKTAFQGGGLGLGLTVSKGIINAHNGRIWVESKKRDLDTFPGSAFFIRLPVSQTNEGQGSVTSEQ